VWTWRLSSLIVAYFESRLGCLEARPACRIGGVSVAQPSARGKMPDAVAQRSFVRWLVTSIVLPATLLAQIPSTASQPSQVQINSAPGRTRHYVSSRGCLFEFDYPSSWMIVQGTDPEACRVTLRPVDFAARMKELDSDVYTLDIDAGSGPFLSVAADAGFDFVKGEWVLVGRHHMKADAELVSIGPWNGLRGFAVAGCNDHEGKYVGICEQPVIVLRDDDERVWSMRGGPQSEEAFDQIVASFRFREP
jgi:hypothetical protein